MNKKMIFTPTQQEVKVGDLIQIGPTKYIVNNSTLPYLVGLGFIIFIDNESKLQDEIPSNLNYYLQRLANRKGWYWPQMENYVTELAKINKSCVFSILLMEIALTLDTKYPDSINNSPEIYCISLGNGKITKLNKALIKSYKNFAAFRSIGDAKFACSVLKDILKEMFK